ncbi:hypothetical protein AV530_000612 [Patagioenas fasciata monilis]|uniref:Uncharacterized protein n=1 Tax=Patagioenas fasciata monilis TaxID=372326 RepID=A0A1V4IGS6_PATFA|nr:hypothetical protein AV530_000612 [Patagioenas fasciata monilis]
MCSCRTGIRGLRPIQEKAKGQFLRPNSCTAHRSQSEAAAVEQDGTDKLENLLGFRECCHSAAWIFQPTCTVRKADCQRGGKVIARKDVFKERTFAWQRWESKAKPLISV